MITAALREIRDAIRSNCEDVTYIDLDRGQLENPKAFATPFVSALVLINFNDGFDWVTMQKNNQRGTVNISVKIAVRLPDDQFLEEDLDSNLEALDINEHVNAAIINMGGMQRINTKSYYRQTLYIIEHTYLTGFDYVPNVPKYKEKLLNKDSLQLTVELDTEP